MLHASAEMIRLVSAFKASHNSVLAWPMLFAKLPWLNGRYALYGLGMHNAREQHRDKKTKEWPYMIFTVLTALNWCSGHAFTAQTPPALDSLCKDRRGER
jgi:hypothetical protein